MYDATTRNTYAELFKTADEALAAKTAGRLTELLHKHPLLAASLASTGAAAGGALLGDKRRDEIEKARMNGYQSALGMGGGR